MLASEVYLEKLGYLPSGVRKISSPNWACVIGWLTPINYPSFRHALPRHSRDAQ
jgi:hypothetical protein